ncbi:hypothetical protein L9F63_004663, partial [Diploptera punctata]
FSPLKNKSSRMCVLAVCLPSLQLKPPAGITFLSGFVCLMAVDILSIMFSMGELGRMYIPIIVTVEIFTMIMVASACLYEYHDVRIVYCLL